MIMATERFITYGVPSYAFFLVALVAATTHVDASVFYLLVKNLEPEVTHFLNYMTPRIRA
jgi:hypothetical protein